MDPPIQTSLFQGASTRGKETLAAAVGALKKQNVFIGTSSWRYEGWLGQIYTPERYQTRGRFSKKKFQEECIQEYAEVFPVVGGDFSFDSIPTAAFWGKLFRQDPQHLKWSLKVPEDFTKKEFPRLERYGMRQGQINSAFLDAAAFQAGFLEPLAPYFDRLAVLILEFGTFSKAAYPEPRVFFDDLEKFLARLPRSVRYCVELRKSRLLEHSLF